jgi:hypothetical protein
LYPSTEWVDGAQVISISASNSEKRPVSVCREVEACLSFEVETSAGVFRPWQRLQPEAAPADPGPASFVVLAPDETRDQVFLLKVRPLPERGPRAFAIGPAHFFPELPSRAGFRFRYQAAAAAIQAARRLKLPALFLGPAEPSSSPNVLELPSREEALAAFRKGEFNSHLRLPVGDPAVLSEAERALASGQFELQQEAVRALIHTGLPEAAPLLAKAFRTSDDGMIRAEAAGGFLVIHPDSIVGEVIALAKGVHPAGAGLDEGIQTTLVMAVGSTDNPAHLPALRQLQKELGPSQADDEHFKDSRDFAFLLARARLGEAEAGTALFDRLKRVPPDQLGEIIRQLPYTRSPAVARGLLGYFRDGRKGGRIAPDVLVGAPWTPEQRRRYEEFERNAYVRVMDEALIAITEMFPDLDFGVKVAPARKYRPAEFERVRRRVMQMAAGSAR